MDNERQIHWDPPAASHHIIDAKQMDLYLEQVIMAALEHLCVTGANQLLASRFSSWLLGMAQTIQALMLPSKK